MRVEERPSGSQQRRPSWDCTSGVVHPSQYLQQSRSVFVAGVDYHRQGFPELLPLDCRSHNRADLHAAAGACLQCADAALIDIHVWASATEATVPDHDAIR